MNVEPYISCCLLETRVVIDLLNWRKKRSKISKETKKMKQYSNDKKEKKRHHN